MKKVSFDFDSTLTRTDVQKFAKDLIDSGLVDVWICTSRFDNNRLINKDSNNDLFKLVDELGISKNNIIFTNFEDKANYLNDDFIWHLDDDHDELDEINKRGKTIGISVFGNNVWRNKCIKFLINNINGK